MFMKITDTMGIRPDLITMYSEVDVRAKEGTTKAIRVHFLGQEKPLMVYDMPLATFEKQLWLQSTTPPRD